LFKGFGYYCSCCSREHLPGLLQTSPKAKSAYFLRIGANRDHEKGSRDLSLTSDGALRVCKRTMVPATLIQCRERLLKYYEREAT
jgi:hypothetical protein